MMPSEWATPLQGSSAAHFAAAFLEGGGMRFLLSVDLAQLVVDPEGQRGRLI